MTLEVIESKGLESGKIILISRDIGQAIWIQDLPEDSQRMLKVLLAQAGTQTTEKDMGYNQPLAKVQEDASERKLRFVPPKGDDKLPRYASYGRGVMKTHTSLGAAKQSLKNRCIVRKISEDGTYSRDLVWDEGYILEIVDGEWYTLYHVERNTPKGNPPWVKKYWSVRGYWHAGKYFQEEPPEYGGPYAESYESLPMTREEYAEWRVKVELERLRITPAKRDEILRSKGGVVV